MSLDFSNYLFLSDNSTGCDTTTFSEPNDSSNTGSGCNTDERPSEKLCRNQSNGIFNGEREPSSGNPSNVPKSVTDECDNAVSFQVFSERPSADVMEERATSAERIQAWKTGCHETLSWNGKLVQLSKQPLRLESTYSSVGDLSKLLQSLKTSMTMGPTGQNDPDPGRLKGGNPDGQDSDRMPPRQPAYHNRKSLPGRLTDDHVTLAKHEIRRKYSRRGSVKFADQFGLNLNTFVMIPSRFSVHVPNDVSWHLHPDNRKWRSDDRISTDDNRNAATDGFRAMGPRCDFVDDFGLIHSLDEINGTLWPDWGSLDFWSNGQLLHENLRHSSSNRHFARENRPSKQDVVKPETTKAEVATQEAEEGVVGQRHEFRLRFEQPFADLSGFQRKLRENFLCLENVRVDDRSSRSGDDDHSGTGPSRKRQSTTILCSIKVRHTDGGGGGRGIVVFSRCTDNDWLTYADLPAQHLSGVANLGFDYDTYCFAVRKPVQPPREDDQLASNAWPTSAVEFALCCRVTKEGGTTISHWDNNDGANYRIEWFDD